MDYAEASYFDGYHFHHIAAYREQQRIIRIREQSARASRERRSVRR